MKSNRALHQDKARKPIVGKGKPHSKEGVEGDLSIRSLKNGIFLFVKYGSLWYKVSQLEVHNPSHSNQNVLNAMSGASGNSGQTAKGGLGDTGIGTGAKFFLDTIKTRLGIKGNNYIQSGTSAASLGRDSTNSDTSFMNLALDNEPLLILSGIKGSDNTPETITFKSNLEDANGQIFHFLKERNGTPGTDTDVIADIIFSGQNKEVNPLEHQFAKIRAQVVSGVNNQEKGQLTFAVAEYDGTVTTGLSIVGQAADGEVDVTIGAGAASMTTIAGDLDIDGDTITTAGAIALDSGGSVTLDAHDGNFIAKKAGTQFSAANSAYAGMILGYTRIQNDATTAGHGNISISNSAFTVLQTAQGTDVKVAFTGPPSGIVEIECRFDVYSASKGVKFSLSDNASYNEIAETHTYDADYNVYQDETDHYPVVVTFAVDGLTAGASFTYYLAALCNTTGAYIRHGRNRTGGTHYPPILMKATALPAGIFKGE